ncbi:MAG: carbohydrate ABC transporter permease [Treponema sp.]|jgi:putative aldouronate transport system permease protein|nr:carbohydrate ABC transporter permease [Treponema sp.]
MAEKRKKLEFQDRLPLGWRLGLYLCLFLAVIVMGIPMLNVLAVSFSESAKSESPGLILFPAPFTIEGYDFIWNHQNLWRPFLITLYVSAAGTLIHVFLSSLAGYVLYHRGLPLRNLLTTFVMLTMTVPGELTLVSTYEMFRQLGLINTYTALIISGAAGGFSVLLMRNYFTGVPASLAEASRIDGASDFMIFRKVFLPLSVPGLMTIGTLQFIGRWNSITNVVTLISDQKMYTLPVVLRIILNEQSSTSGTAYIFSNARMAAVALTALPLVALYFFTQRFFNTGVTLGATKE